MYRISYVLNIASKLNTLTLLKPDKPGRNLSAQNMFLIKNALMQWNLGTKECKKLVQSEARPPNSGKL